ncbi:hypothetical protein BUALT_Bualt12G0019500 [Buddleja alternifolia]|uniref:Glycosyltransferase N-terminal domain-containing protein n=1 Tax=Buddleja alternifolia TaxID=168488 RepID=A0AAV6WNC8_9LAMI|nr:hypothetical protein BUALT_Bualt12G0019500 [Buddleja alternifolia]
MANNHSPQNGVAVVMVPLPAQGHLNQLLHLSRLIAAVDNLTVYYAAAATFLRQAKLRAHHPSSIAAIKFHEFPDIPFHNPPPNANSSINFPSQIIPSLIASTNLRQPVYEFVNELSRSFRRVVVIYDSLMAYVVQDMDLIPNADFYRFRSISAISVCSFEEEEAPDDDSTAEILKEIPSMDGHYPPEFGEFLNLQSSASEIFSGEIYNSSGEIEGLFLDLLAKRNQEKKIWAIGPFNPVLKPENYNSKTHHELLDWLGKQELNSVIFISFGSTCSFSDEQVKEIAFGNWASRDELVSSVRVEKVVRKLMGSEEGDGIRKRAKELGDVVKKSLMEGGDTRKEMDSFITHITR